MSKETTNGLETTGIQKNCNKEQERMLAGKYNKEGLGCNF
jgi:hypothetical protein